MVDRATITFSDFDELQAYEETAETRAEQKLIQITNDLDSTDQGSQSIHVRDALPGEDLDTHTEAGSSLVSASSPEFQVSVPDGDDGQYNSLYKFDNDAGLEDKAAVLYGFMMTDPADDADFGLASVKVSTVNSEIGEFDLQAIKNGDYRVVVFEHPLIVGKDDRFLEAYVKAGLTSGSAVDLPVKPLIKVAEQSGNTFSQSDSYADTGV
jgi:hypothetical protein